MSDDGFSPIASTPAKISLREQADEAHRELVNRHRYYPSQVKSGKMSAQDAEVGYAVMRAIRDTMRLFAEYEPEMRQALKAAIEAHREIANSPLAKTVLEAFPGAAVEIHPLDDQFEFMGSGATDAGEPSTCPPSTREGSPAP